MMKNPLNILAWLSGALGILFIIVGLIALGVTVFSGKFFLGHRWESFFYPATPLVMIGIFLFLAIIVNKDCCKAKDNR